MIYLYVIAFTILSAVYDNGKRFEHHCTRVMLRGVVFSLISYFYAGNFFINFFTCVIVFYVLFDYLLNYLEGRKWNYIGNTASIDKIWNKIGWQSQLFFKTLLIFTLWIIK